MFMFSLYMFTHIYTKSTSISISLYYFTTLCKFVLCTKVFISTINVEIGITPFIFVYAYVQRAICGRYFYVPIQFS